MKAKCTLDKLKWIVLTTGLVIVSSLVFSFIKGLLLIDVGNTESVNQSIQVNPWYLFVPLLIAPIIEEWLFRKKLTNFFRKSVSNKEAILFANGVFAILHFDWFFFPYFVNGCLYALSYEKTKDLKVPILAHVSYNSFVFLATGFLAK
ncbi:CPBP family intramembrane metalloprotease [Bacillus anthracis]|nr:CPBP family intramembrane metalloprotease [Bacillus anthracis]